MISAIRLGISLAMASMVFLMPGPALAGSCEGKFPNPVTDICWRCMLPLSIGSARVANLGNQTDIGNPGSPICACGSPIPKVGVSLGFWEPALLAEVPRQPYCFPILGGLEMNTGGYKKTQHSRSPQSTMKPTSTAFYHAHHYVFPILYLMGVLYDHPCIVQNSIDLGFMTELDPTWNDPALSSWINPEAYLFANPAALAACAADCVAASVDKPLAATPWCAGCQGSLHPMQGFVPHHTGGITTSLLLTQRLEAKMHKMLVAWQYHGSDALCGPYPNPVMDRQAYKTQMLYPIPNTRKINGKCCQNFGESSTLWGSGKEFPLGGEDFAYLLFRKRNCCMILY